MAPKMEFFRNAQNFTMGNVEFNTVQGDYHDHSVRNVRNTYGNKNRYYTNNSNSFNNHANNFAGGYTAPSTNYNGNVNNIGSVQNATFGDNYGTTNQGTTTYAAMPPPGAPAGSGIAQGPPPRPGPAPGNQGFTASSTAIPQHQGYQQHLSPPLADPLERPRTGPPVPEGNRVSQQKDQGPPPAFPPMGSQGYPQHPPQNPGYRPTDSLPPPPQQQQRPEKHKQREEQWPGQFAYQSGMAHLKKNTPSSWSDSNSESSDESDDDRLDKNPYRQRKQKQKAMKPDNRMGNVGPSGGGQGASMSVGSSGFSATAAGGARLAVDFGAAQAVPPPPPQGVPPNPGLPHRASPAAPPSRGHTPQPQVAQRNPSPTPQRGHSPQPAPPQQLPQQVPSPATPPVATTENTLQVPPRDVPMSNMAAHLALTANNPRRRSTEMTTEGDDGTEVTNEAAGEKKKKRTKIIEAWKRFSK